MSQSVTVGDRAVGPGRRALLIAEVGLIHDGSLGTAHAYVDAVAAAGADAVKFQTHIATAESTFDEPFRTHFSQQDKSRFEYWERTAFTEPQWKDLAAHARDRDLLFLSSAFSVAAVDLLTRVGVPAWKVGSGEFRSLELLEAMGATELPVLLSTGMSSLDEIERGVEIVRAAGSEVALFQSTSRYPSSFEKIGLNVMAELRSAYGVPVGLSDHSGTPWPAVAAMTLGAEMIEVHVTLDRRAFGPDVPASLTVDELRSLTLARDAIHTMLTNPVDKNHEAVELEPLRSMFTKSLALRTDLPAGTVLTADLLTQKKPGTGIGRDEIDRVVGRRLRRAVTSDRLLRWEDLDG